MTYTRRVMWECEREYDTLEEAEADEDNFLKETFPNDINNPELYTNELSGDESEIVDTDEEESQEVSADSSHD